jgi:hypothetical protein
MVFDPGREAHQRRLLGLRRRDVDLLRGVVHVHVQAQQLSGEGRVVSGPKSEAGTRTVSLLAIVIDALKQQLSEFAEPGPDGVVFTGPREDRSAARSSLRDGEPPWLLLEGRLACASTTSDTMPRRRGPGCRASPPRNL